jgi:trimeric autotransporter adhesin
MKLLVSKTAATVVTAAAALLAIPAMASAAPTHAAVAKHPSKVSVSASPRVAFAGTVVKLSATVSSANPKPTGLVSFWWGHTRLCAARVVNRSAHCYTEFLGAGTYGVRAIYWGDAQHRGATGYVRAVATKAGTSTNIAVSTTTPTLGQRVTFTAVVSSRSRLAVAGWVHFTVGSTTLCSGSVHNGRAICGYAWKSAGSYRVTATYLGDRAHGGSASTSGTITVKVPAPTMYATTTTITNVTPNPVDPGKSAIVTVTVTSPAGAPAATGTVAVTPTGADAGLAGFSCTVETLTDGTGTCTITPAADTFGDITYDAAYSGDATHLPSKYTAGYTVMVPAPTTTGVTFSTAGGTVGTAETITATVANPVGDNISPTAGGTGTVTFSIGGVNIAGCTAVPLVFTQTGTSGTLPIGTNTATCTYTPTAADGTAGSVTVAAAYTGDGTNQPSSGTGTQTVTG